MCSLLDEVRHALGGQSPSSEESHTASSRSCSLRVTISLGADPVALLDTPRSGGRSVCVIPAPYKYADVGEI